MSGPAIPIPPEERMMALLAHLSGLAGYLVPLGGVVVPIAIWIVKKDDRIVAAIARQAVLLNVVVFLIAACLLVLFLTIILIPLAIVGWIVLGLAAVVLPVIGAVKASGGEYFAYPLVGGTP